MNELNIDDLDAPDIIKAEMQSLQSDFFFYRESSKGANGYLYFGKNRITNQDIAIKFYYYGEDKKYHPEPSQLSQINSPNVIKINNASFLDDEWAYFITPTCQHGDLDDFIHTKPSIISSIDIISGILNGISYLHEKRYLHRDLKPSNLYLCEASQAVIGDFGSVKFLPEEVSEIPASRHSILYRPPESVLTERYSIVGDIYQIGIVLYQLLGGYLPYDEISWLSEKEKVAYDEITDNVDKSLYVDMCLKDKISKGKILDFSTLPLWIPKNLKNIIQKACNRKPDLRYQSASAFQAAIHHIRPSINDWKLVDNVLLLEGKTSYQLIFDDHNFIVQKKTNDIWRNDRVLSQYSLQEAVDEINKRI